MVLKELLGNSEWVKIILGGFISWTYILFWKNKWIFDKNDDIPHDDDEVDDENDEYDDDGHHHHHHHNHHHHHYIGDDEVDDEDDDYDDDDYYNYNAAISHTSVYTIGYY